MLFFFRTDEFSAGMFFFSFEYKFSAGMFFFLSNISFLHITIYSGERELRTLRKFHTRRLFSEVQIFSMFIVFFLLQKGLPFHISS